MPSENEEEKSEPKPKEPGEQSPEAAETRLEKELAEAKQNAESYLDGWKRAQADFINYKRRLRAGKAGDG